MKLKPTTAMARMAKKLAIFALTLTLLVPVMAPVSFAFAEGSEVVTAAQDDQAQGSTATMDESSAAAEESSASPEESSASSEESSASSEESSASAEESSAPSDESSAPSDESSAPAEESSVPEEKPSETEDLDSTADENDPPAAQPSDSMDSEGPAESEEASEQTPDPALTFDFSGSLTINAKAFMEADTDEALQSLFLADVTVTDENGSAVPDVWVSDFGGFHAEAENGAEFTVTYSANHPVSGETFTSERTAILEKPVIAVQSLPRMFPVTFYDADGTIFYETTVEENKPVPVPAQIPELPEGKTAFLGWFLDADSENIFDFSTPVTGELRLYAGFRDLLLVSFKDEAGNVMATQEVGTGDKAVQPSEDKNPVSANTENAFQYWYVENDANKMPYDFETPVVSNLTLVPFFSNVAYVYFVSGGNETVPSQAVAINKKAMEPVGPFTRAGFTFKFWSTNPDATWEDEATEKYNFDTPVTDYLVLYGIWQGVDVPYTVAYWFETPGLAIADMDDDSEKNNLDNYTFAFQTNLNSDGTPKKAPAGTLYTVTEAEAALDTANNVNYATDYRILNLFGKYWKCVSAEIQANGSTVINVYYTRNIYTFKFYLDKSNQDPTTFQPEKDGKIYTNEAGAEKYTVHAKLGGEFEPPLPPFFHDPTDLKTATVKRKNYPNSYPTQWSSFGGDSYGMGLFTSYWQGTARWRDESGNLTNGDPNKEVVVVPHWTSGGNYIRTNDAYHMYSLLKGEVDKTGTDPNYLNYKGEDSILRQYKTETISYSQTHTVANSPFGGAMQNIPGVENIRQKEYYYNTSAVYKDANGNLVSNTNYASGVPLYFFYARKEYKLTFDSTINNAQSDTVIDKIQYGYPLGGPNASAVQAIDWTGNPPEAYYPNDLQNGTVVGNWRFLGWYEDSDYNYPVQWDTYTMPPRDTVLYAKWEPLNNAIEVSFYDKLNGSKVDSKTVTIGQTVSPSATYTVGQGYDNLGQFIGWGADIGGTVSLYNFKNQVLAGLDLYGIWKTDNFTITYTDQVDGSITVPTDHIRYDLNTLAPVKNAVQTSVSGKTFIGWQKDGKGMIYYPGTVLRMNSDVRLVAFYADSAAAKVNITYHANYPGGATDVQQVLANSTTVTKGNTTFTRSGYTLIGWATTASGGVVYPCGAEITAGTTDINLYAVWSKGKTFTVTFLVDTAAHGYLDTAGTFEKRIEVLPYSLFDAVTFPQAKANDGFLFDSWKYSTGSKPMYVTGNVTVTARYTAVPTPEFIVRYLPGSHGTFTERVHTGLTPNTAMPEPPEVTGQTGWRFAGWSPERSTTVTQSVDYTAQWEQDVLFTVRYLPGSHGTFTERVHTGIIPNAAMPEPPEVTGQTGWRFAGWSPERSAAVTQSVDYIAQWERNSFSSEPSSPRPSNPPGSNSPDSDLPTSSLPDSSAPSPTPPEPSLPGESSMPPDDGTGGIVAPDDGDNDAGGTTTPDDDDDDADAGDNDDDGPDGDPPAGPTDPENDSEAPGPDTRDTDSEPANTPPDEIRDSGVENIVTPPVPLNSLQQFLTEIFDGEVPLANIFGNDVPLFAPVSTGAWALVNLLLSIIGAMFAVAAIVRAILKKKKKEKQKKETTESKEQLHTEDVRQNRIRLICLLVGVAIGIGGVVLFLLTEDTSQQKVLIDNWTIAHVLLLAIEIVAMVFAFKILTKTVVFVTNAGKRYRQKVRSGEMIVEPETPNRQGYVFAGWFLEKTCVNLWDFGKRVQKNFKLYAKWNEIQVVQQGSSELVGK